MDFIVNVVYVELLLFLFPLYLMRLRGADFVLNSFGVAFITAIDNLKGPEETLVVGR